VLHAQEAVEHLPQGADVVQVVENDDVGQIAGRGALTLVRYVSEVLAQLLRGLVIYVKRSNSTGCYLLTRPTRVCGGGEKLRYIYYSMLNTKP
jgi:hypothetical protein